MKRNKIKSKLRLLCDEYHDPLRDRWEFCYKKANDFCPHRLNDRPARWFLSGSKHYFIDGKLHRENNKPAVIWWDGKKEYWVKDKRIK